MHSDDDQWKEVIWSIKQGDVPALQKVLGFLNEDFHKKANKAIRDSLGPLIQHYKNNKQKFKKMLEIVSLPDIVNMQA